MRKNWLTLLFIFAVSISVTAQVQTFTRDSLAYALDLPSASWLSVSRVDVHDHVEFINVEAANGYLRIQKKLVTPGATAADLFRAAEKWDLRRLPGYVVCSGGKGPKLTGITKERCFRMNSLRREGRWKAAFTISRWISAPSIFFTSRSRARSWRVYLNRWTSSRGASG